MPVEIINLQRTIRIDPVVLSRIASLGLDSLGRSKDNISLIFVNDPRMRALNFQFKGKKKTTDVLSFSYPKEKSFKGMESPDGEIVISLPKAEKQAFEAGISLFDEVINLIIHGLCHLKGYDHEKGNREMLIMKNAERKTARFIEKNRKKWDVEQKFITGKDAKGITSILFKGKIPDDCRLTPLKSREIPDPRK